MEMFDLIGKNVKISKGSITCKNENGKTCGIVTNIVSFYDMQANKKCDLNHKMKKLGVPAMKYGLKNIIIKDNEVYFMYSIKARLYYQKYGYFDEYEKNKQEEREQMIQGIKDKGLNVIECIY